MIRAVLFDLDGTLVNSSPALMYGVNRLLSELDIEPLTLPEVEMMVGKGVYRLFEKIFAYRKVQISPDMQRTHVARYIEIMTGPDTPPAELFPNVYQVIESLRCRGIKTALVTNKDGDMTQACLRDVGLSRAFDVICTGSDVRFTKPAPDIIHLACRLLDVSEQDALMVGDSCNDALAAKAAGTRIALVRTGYNEGEPIDSWAHENGNLPVYDSVSEAVQIVVDAF